MPKFEPCVTCGGTEYYNEAGFYYCSECQLQTQEVREFVFDDPPPLVRTKTKVFRKEKKTAEQVTSWECYNYVLLGLTDELVNLGAGARFKRVVQALWFKYLKLIEVIREDPCEPPKLQAYNNKVDAKIVYKRMTPKVKRKRRTSMSSGSDGESSVHSKRVQGLLKKAFMQAEYDAMSSQLADTSLINASLGSLTNLSSEEPKKQRILQYEKKARKELATLMPVQHLSKHEEDVNDDLPCHKITYTDLKNRYRFGPEVLKRSKLYTILYLALLITRERMQLGDLLRFMQEGHISLNYFKHFFPECLLEKELNMTTLKKNQHNYNHHFLRDQAGKFAVYLGVDDLLAVPDLADLARRYCKEMNLPRKISVHVINLIAYTEPRLQVLKKGEKFPNYEGRVAALIIFVLKLFLGMDGVTEFALSKLAARTDEDIFNFKDWLDYICYRKLVLSRHHFPTQLLHSEDVQNSDAYIEHMRSYYDGLELECDNNIEYTVIKDLLDRLKERFMHKQSGLKFEPSLTPFRDYTEALVNSETFVANGYSRDVLVKDFENASLDYSQFKDIEVVKGGANKDVKLLPMYARGRVPRIDHIFACNFTDDYRAPSTSAEKPSGLTISEEIEGDVLYRPETSYWMLSCGDFSNMTQDHFKKYFKTFPATVRVVVEEFARVTGQSAMEIIEELNVVENYLCYAFDFVTCEARDVLPKDMRTARLVDKSKMMW